MATPFYQEIEDRRRECEKAEQKHRSHLLRIQALTEKSWFWCGEWKQSGKEVNEKDLPRRLRNEFERYTVIEAPGTAIVRRTTCYDIPVVEKKIAANRQRLNLIREEAIHSQKVDGHRHIIRLVGAYSSVDRDNRFNILYFPVADCNFDKFLSDYDKSATKNFAESLVDTSTNASQDSKRIYMNLVMTAARGPLPSVSTSSTRLLNSWQEATVQLQQFLREAMGCITEGVRWLHENNISHQDLKPANILLRNGQLYLTDFGISRDRQCAEDPWTDTYLGKTRGYCSPQLENEGRHWPMPDDIYALGCVFTHMVTLMYRDNANEAKRVQCSELLTRRPHDRESHIRQHFQISEQDNTSWAPEAELIKMMLKNNVEDRPNIATIIEQLRRVGETEGEGYYNECCLEPQSPLKAALPQKQRIFCKSCIAISPPTMVDGVRIEDAICRACGKLQRRKRLYCSICDRILKGGICRCGSEAVCENGCGTVIPKGECKPKLEAKEHFRHLARNLGRSMGM